MGQLLDTAAGNHGDEENEEAHPLDREARVYQALDELSHALGEFDGDEELKAIAPYVEADKVESVISQVQTIIGE